MPLPSRAPVLPLKMQPSSWQYQAWHLHLHTCNGLCSSPFWAGALPLSGSPAKTVPVAQCSWTLLIMWRMAALGHFPLIFSLLVHPCHIIVVINVHVVFSPFSTLSELVMWHLINYRIINRYRSGWLPSATRATWTTWATQAIWVTQSTWATWATWAMLTIPAIRSTVDDLWC